MTGAESIDGRQVVTSNRVDDHDVAAVTGSSMRAVVARRFAPPHDLVVEDVPVPEVPDGHVRIRVRAVALNPADWHGVVGRPYIARPGLGWFAPRRSIPGTDVAGTVESVGAGTSRFAVGDDVFGFADGGGCAEFVTVPEANVVARPEAVPFESAASVGVAAFVALQAVRDVARLEADDHVLVNGATGGVGHFIVQLAVSRGCEVTAVCSTANVDVATSMGAHHVLDYSVTDFTQGSARYDAILDNPGNHPLRACRGVLRPNGVYVLIGGSKSSVFGPIPRIAAAKLLGLVSSQRFALAFGRETPEDLDGLRALLERGTIEPIVGRTLPLDEVPAALDEIGRGHTRGKLVAVP